MKRIFQLALLPIAGLALTACNDTPRDSIVVERDSRVVRKPPRSHWQWDGWEELENGLIRAYYLVPPNFMASAPAHPVDPFANPDPLPKRKPQEAQQVLESYGIVFEGSASALYLPDSRLVRVIQTKDQLELVEAVLEGGVGPEPLSQILIRSEIFELPAISAIEVMESLSVQGEHRPERDAIHRAVQNGNVKLVAAPTVIARSGQRAKTEKVRQIADRETKPNQESEEADAPDGIRREMPELSFEVDPIIGPDNYTIDLNFQLTLEDTEAPNSLQNITTQVTSHDGDWIFVGSWSGRTPNTMILIFLNATIQTLGDAGEMVKFEESTEKAEP